MGDDGGFREFVAARSPALLRTAFLLVGERALAEDLVQSALANAYRHAETSRTPVLSGGRPVRQDRRLCASSWSGPGSSA